MVNQTPNLWIRWTTYRREATFSWSLVSVELSFTFKHKMCLSFYVLGSKVFSSTYRYDQSKSSIFDTNGDYKPKDTYETF